MGRELRKVPAGWDHPKTSDGKFQPMFNEFYGDAMDTWIKAHNDWLAGTHSDLIDDPSLKEKYPFYAMYHGGCPDVEYYHTKKYTEAELTHIQLYETTSEGTPKGPVFRADEFEKLCEWAAVNATTFASFKATKEEWMKMLSNGLVFHQSGNVMFL